MLQQSPAMIDQLVEQISQRDPELAAQIRADPQAFMQQLMARGGEAGGMPGMGAPPQGVVRLTEEESQAVARLTELGFNRQVAAQAYLACDKNEELAANYLS